MYNSLTEYMSDVAEALEEIDWDKAYDVAVSERNCSHCLTVIYVEFYSCQNVECRKKVLFLQGIAINPRDPCRKEWHTIYVNFTINNQRSKFLKSKKANQHCFDVNCVSWISEALQIQEPDANRLRMSIPSPFDALTAHHLRTLYFIANQRFEDAFKSQAHMLTIVAKELLQKRKDENWFLPITYRLCSDLRLCSKAADLRPSRPRAPEESSYYEKSASSIMECYRGCIADLRAPFEVSKRLSVLNLTNQLFRVYFRINKLNLLKPLIRAVENSGQLYDYFSMADKVTYKYYIGRKAMFDSDLKTAEDALTFAFVNCHPDNEHNRRLILEYLIPVKMFLGHMPSQKLLRAHDLLQFSEVAEAVK